MSYSTDAETKSLNQRYMILKTLASNSFGSVFFVEDIETHEKLIAKMVKYLDFYVHSMSTMHCLS